MADLTDVERPLRPRYYGIADWYDAQLESAPHRRETLITHLGTGHQLCLDVGSGTGRDLEAIASTGRTPIGVELSTDQKSPWWQVSKTPR